MFKAGSPGDRNKSTKLDSLAKKNELTLALSRGTVNAKYTESNLSNLKKHLAKTKNIGHT